MSVLLTGGAGYIGLNVAAKLLRRTAECVVLLDNFSNSDRTFADALAQMFQSRVEIIEGDVLDVERLNSVFRKRDFSAVLHFAGLKDVNESLAKPEIYRDVNVRGTQNILDFVAKFEIPRLVFSSSASLYHESENSPLSEKSRVLPKTPYGSSKLESEELIAQRAMKLRHVCFSSLRYFNPVGAGKIGDLLLGDCGTRLDSKPLFPEIATSALSGRSRVFQIFGDDYPTRDGTCIRDFINVEDLAEAHILALLRDTSTSKAFEVFNLGTGVGTTVLEVAKAFEAELSRKGFGFEFRVGSRRQGDLAKGFAEISKAVRILGWKPSRSLDLSVNSEIEFRSLYFNSKKYR